MPNIPAVIKHEAQKIKKKAKKEKRAKAEKKSRKQENPDKFLEESLKETES